MKAKGSFSAQVWKAAERARTEGLKALIGFNHLEITGILEAFLSRLCGGGRCQKLPWTTLNFRC